MSDIKSKTYGAGGVSLSTDDGEDGGRGFKSWGKLTILIVTLIIAGGFFADTLVHPAASNNGVTHSNNPPPPAPVAQPEFKPAEYSAKRCDATNDCETLDYSNENPAPFAVDLKSGGFIQRIKLSTNNHWNNANVTTDDTPGNWQVAWCATQPSPGKIHTINEAFGRDLVGCHDFFVQGKGQIVFTTR